MQMQRIFISALGLSLLLAASGKVEAAHPKYDSNSDFTPNQISILDAAFAEAESIALESYNSLSSVPTADRASSPRYLHACDSGSYVVLTLDDWDAFAANFNKLYK